MNTCYAAKTPFAILMAGLGMLSALPAHALVIDGLSGQATAQAGTNVAVNQGPFTSTTNLFVNASDSDPMSYANADAFGYAQGPYRASASGNGIFDSTGRFTRTWDITNDSGVAQDYSFTFFIYYGGMSARDNGAGGTGYAEYAVDIRRDGATSLFSSTAKIASDGTLTTTGTILDGASQFGSQYNWGGTYFTVNLGTLNVGQSTSVAYDLVSHAFGNYGFTDCGSGYGGGYGDGDFIAPLEIPRGSNQCTGISSSSLGDPDQLNATPIQGIGIFARNAVPEPGTLGLLGLGGLAALGLRRRRR